MPVIGSGHQRLQPVFISDVAAAVADSLEEPSTDGRTLEIGGPDVMTMNEVVDTMLSVMRLRRRKLHAPAFLLKAAGAVLRFLPKPPLSPAAVTFITMDALADTTELLEVLDLKLTPLHDALSLYLSPR